MAEYAQISQPRVPGVFGMSAEYAQLLPEYAQMAECARAYSDPTVFWKLSVFMAEYAQICSTVVQHPILDSMRYIDC